jgi:hypothetical protein
MLTDEGIEPCTTSSSSRTSIKYESYAREVHKAMERQNHGGGRGEKHTGEGCSVFGFTCSYVRMGGIHASATGRLGLLPLVPSEEGGTSVDEFEFKRTYFGICRAGANDLLDVTKARRRGCEANVLESIEVYWRMVSLVTAQTACDVTCFGLAVSDIPRTAPQTRWRRSRTNARATVRLA